MGVSCITIEQEMLLQHHINRFHLSHAYSIRVKCVCAQRREACVLYYDTAVQLGEDLQYDAEEDEEIESQ